MKAKNPAKYKPAEKPSPRVGEVAASEIGAFAAKTHLSAILDQVAHGQTFYVTKHGKRIAEIRPATPEARPRPIPGLWKGRMWIADDFDAPLADFKEYME